MHSLNCPASVSSDSKEFVCGPLRYEWTIDYKSTKDPLQVEVTLSCSLPETATGIPRDTQDDFEYWNIAENCSCQATILGSEHQVVEEPGTSGNICQCHICDIDTVDSDPILFALSHCSDPVFVQDTFCGHRVNCSGNCDDQQEANEDAMPGFPLIYSTPRISKEDAMGDDLITPSAAYYEMSSGSPIHPSASIAQSASLLWLLGFLAINQNTTAVWTESLTHKSIAGL